MEFSPVIPTLRIFDEARAREFWLDFLGFESVFEHRYDDGLPMFMIVKRDNCIVHLSEHNGDGAPGVHLRFPMTGVDEFAALLRRKNYKYSRPGDPEDTKHGTRDFVIGDPFGNQLTFSESRES